MKNKFLGLAVLAIAAVAAFAFKAVPVETKAVQVFYLQAGGTSYNPLDYSTTGVTCLGSNVKICQLDAIAASEIYTSAESLSVHGNLSYLGKPKVDIATNQIKLDVDASLADPANTKTFANGRFISEKP